MCDTLKAELGAMSSRYRNENDWLRDMEKQLRSIRDHPRGVDAMNHSEILIYQDQQGKIRIDVHLQDETVWLTHEHMAQLFGKAKSTINEHIKNIFAEGELVEAEVMKKFGISEFQQKAPNYYNHSELSESKHECLPIKNSNPASQP